MWFTKQLESQTTSTPTPLKQLEQLRQLRRAAKAEFDRDWTNLQKYLNTNPPLRRPFMLNDTLFYVPVNFLASVPANQRRLEKQVDSSKARWSTLQKQESALEFALGLKR